jgi:hypothetical protein
MILLGEVGGGGKAAKCGGVDANGAAIVDATKGVPGAGEKKNEKKKQEVL